MPVLDNLESEVQKDENGVEFTAWFLQRNPQFKHLNLCLNKISAECLDRLEEVLHNSNDEFGFTISGNPVTITRVKEIHSKIEKLHKKRV